MSLRRFVQVGVALGILASFGMIACGQVEAPTPADGLQTPGAGPNVDDLPRLYADAICARYLACSGIVSDAYGFAPRCVPEVQSAIEDRDFLETRRLVAAQKLSYDPALAKACIDGVSALACEDLTLGTPSACPGAFGGKAPVGSPCFVDAECAGESFCDPRSACPGVCAAKNTAGGPCSDNDHCAGALGCFGGRCGRPAMVGAACGGQVVCDGGALCAATTHTNGDERPVCKRIADLPVAKNGEACDFGLGTYCGDGNACFYTGGGHTASYHCGPKVGSGAPCLFAVPDPCPLDEYCPVDLDASPLVLEGVCTRRLVPGQWCGLAGTSSGGCVAGDACEPARPGEPPVCIPVERLGGPCRSSSTCFSGLCRGDVCVEGLACEPRGD